MTVYQQTGSRRKIMNDDRLLSVQQAAERLGLKESTIRRMILERRIDVVRPSVRAVRIPVSAIEEIVRRGYQAALTA
jgi:excisionase family DNA binding protein